MSKQLILTILLVATALNCTSVNSQERREISEYKTYGASASQENIDAITELLEVFKKAWSEQNTNNLMSVHSDDTEWINAYGRMFQSRSSLAKFLNERLFPNFDPETSKREMENLTPISTRYINHDAAVVHLYTEGNRGASRNAGEKLRRTHLHLVLANEKSGWKIVHTAIFDVR